MRPQPNSSSSTPFCSPCYCTVTRKTFQAGAEEAENPCQSCMCLWLNTLCISLTEHRQEPHGCVGLFPQVWVTGSAAWKNPCKGSECKGRGTITTAAQQTFPVTSPFPNTPLSPLLGLRCRQLLATVPEAVGRGGLCHGWGVWEQRVLTGREECRIIIQC